MQQRYYDPIAGRFLSVDPVVTDANTGNGFGLYTYVDNNPYSKIDPDGRLEIASWEQIKARNDPTNDPMVQAAGVGLASLAAIIIGTVTNDPGLVQQGMNGPDALKLNAGEGLSMAASLALGGRMGGAPGGAGPKVGAPGFDAARTTAFKKAGMTDPSKVTFSKVDAATGTVVEFKGEGGAKVGYDGPHTQTPGAHHDTQHISWQSAGKRDAGGTKRGNEPYSGPRHPSRPDRKDQKE